MQHCYILGAKVSLAYLQISVSLYCGKALMNNKLTNRIK